MNIIGLFAVVIAVVIGVGVGVWWGSSQSTTMVPTEESSVSSQGAEIIESPQPDHKVAEAVQKIAESVTPGSVEVYKGISVAKNTQSLDLSGRNLEGSLKAEVRQLTELRILDISDNNFTGLPAEIGQLTNLKELNLSNNPFTGLPHELANLHNLQTLDLRGTDYAEYDLNIIKQGLPATVQILID